MPRYLIRSSDDWDCTNDRTMTVHEYEPAPTGILDPGGNMIYRAMNPIGFDLSLKGTIPMAKKKGKGRKC